MNIILFYYVTICYVITDPAASFSNFQMGEIE